MRKEKDNLSGINCKTTGKICRKPKCNKCKPAQERVRARAEENAKTGTHIEIKGATATYLSWRINSEVAISVVNGELITPPYK